MPLQIEETAHLRYQSLMISTYISKKKEKSPTPTWNCCYLQSEVRRVRSRVCGRREEHTPAACSFMSHKTVKAFVALEMTTFFSVPASFLSIHFGTPPKSLP
jgi:hypothetical protein